MKNTKEAVPAAEKNWELKDRVYTLTGNKTPLTYTIKSRNIFWFDPQKQASRISFC